MKSPPKDILLRQQVRVLFWDIDNLLSLFSSISDLECSGKLCRLLKRVTEVNFRLGTLIKECHLNPDNLTRSWEYKRQLGDMSFALKDALRLALANKPTTATMEQE